MGLKVNRLRFGLEGLEDYLYGFPDKNNQGEIKIATEYFGTKTAMADLNRVVTIDEIQEVYEYAKPSLPWLSSECVRSTACVYTQTPDFNFIIDQHPENSNVIFAAGFSGHGFKHSAAIGVALRDLVVDGSTSFDLSSFALENAKNWPPPAS